MSPKQVAFNKRTVLDAAIALVREKGWDALTARGIAIRLKASVAPVYSAFGSMDSLEREILLEARRLLDERTKIVYTESSFLNIGVGMVTFARDESHLFRALFQTRHNYLDIIDGIYTSILERMKDDTFLRLLPDEALRRLLQNIGRYTIGLATSIVYERREDPSTENIIRSLMNAGNMMMFAEVSGLADCKSAASEKEWTRILAEKKILLPQPAKTEGPGVPIGNKDPAQIAIKEKP